MTIAHIYNGELGFDVRTKLNDVIDIANAGGGGASIGGAITGATAGSVLFAGAGGVLAQNNANFFWDNANFVLRAGNRLQQDVNGTFVNALFPVYGGATFANSWFVGESGNTTLTGYNNTAIGFGPMIIASTGHDNTAVGTFALNVLTTSSFNTAVGVDALGELDFPGSTGGDYNSAFGVSSLHALEFGTGNTAIGNRAGNKIGRVIQSDNNTLVGKEAYWTPANGSNNTVVGYRGGYNITSGSNNTLLGCWDGPSSGLSSVIALSDGAGSLLLDYNYTNSGKWTTPAPLVFKGSSSGAVTLAAAAAAGTWTMTLPTSAGTNLYVLQTDGSGITSWVPQSGGGGGSMSIGGSITSATAGSVLFAGAAGILAQDNANFFWDDALNDLHIGGAYYVNAARALYVIPNVSGNNWFEGSAGNQTVTGYNNFGTGDGALHAVTTGYENVAVGTNALNLATDAYSNFAMGSSALRRNVSDSGNTVIGTNACYVLGEAGAGGGTNINNVVIGGGGMVNVKQAFDNVAIGTSALSNVIDPVTANNNVVIGSRSGNLLGSSGIGAVRYNTMVGPNSGSQLSGISQYNTFIGGWRGPVAAVLNNTIAISDGDTIGRFLLDCNIVKDYTWSFNMTSNTVPAAVHLYNMQSPAFTTTNYERAILDWQWTGTMFRIGIEWGGSGVRRIICIDAFAKAGAPAASDLFAGSFAVIDDTSGGATWLVFNKAGTIRKVQLV